MTSSPLLVNLRQMQFGKHLFSVYDQKPIDISHYKSNHLETSSATGLRIRSSELKARTFFETDLKNSKVIFENCFCSALFDNVALIEQAKAVNTYYLNTAVVAVLIYIK